MSTPIKQLTGSDRKSIDLETLIRRIAVVVDQLEPDEIYSLSGLARRTGIDQEKLLYWKKKGILSPLPAHKGRRSVDQYTAIEVEKALLAQELSRLKWKPERIAGAVSFWRRQSTDTPPAPQSELDLLGRAIMLLRARLLALVAKMIGHFEDSPRNCFIMAYHLQGADSQLRSNSITAEEIDYRHVEAILRQQVNVAGISSDIGEVNIYFRDQETLRQKIKNRQFVLIQVRGEMPSQTFALIYGYKENDSQFTTLKQSPAGASSEQLQNGNDWRLLLLLFDMLCVRMDRLGPDLATLPSLATSPVHALVNAINLIQPEKWDFAGFLLPMNDEALKVAFASNNYPVSLKEHIYATDLRNASKASAVAWVYTHRDYLTVEDVSSSDPRLIDVNHERVYALAIIPAIVDGEIIGVLHVGSKQKNHKNPFSFTDEEIRLLHILARITAEAYKREQLSRPEAVMSNLPEQMPAPQNEQDLKESIKNVVDNIVAQARAETGMDNSVLLLAIRLEGYERLLTVSSVASHWLTLNLRRILHQELELLVKDDWESKLPSRVFSLGDDQFVAMIGRTKINRQGVRELRQRISRKLIDLGRLISSDQAEIHVRLWSVQFTYFDLTQQFKLANLKDKSQLEHTVQHILERTKGALKVVNNIYQADAYLRQRLISAAFTEYQVAESADPGNPYVLRHICECLTEMGIFDEAIKYGKKAIDVDSGYAGSHRRLAEAYLRQGNLEEAINNYQHALNRAGKDPMIFLKMAQTLILQADPTKFELIIETLTQAMSYDMPNPKVRAMYLRYKGDACMTYRKYNNAVSWYEQALNLDPENKDVEWELGKARYQMQANKSGT